MSQCEFAGVRVTKVEHILCYISQRERERKRECVCVCVVEGLCVLVYNVFR